MTGRRLRSIRCHRRLDSGAAAVEFALVSVLLLTLTFGIIQYGFYFWASQVGSSAVRDSARYSAVGTKDCAGLRSMVTSQMGGAATGATTTTRSYSPTPAVTGGTVSVTVSYEALNIRFPFVPVPNDGKIIQSAQARVERATSTSVNCP